MAREACREKNQPWGFRQSQADSAWEPAGQRPSSTAARTPTPTSTQALVRWKATQGATATRKREHLRTVITVAQP